MEGNRNSDLRDRGTGELLKELSDHTTTLVRKEIELAKAELGEKGKKAGMGAGMFGGAGLLGVLALAGVLALQGRNKVQEATPPLPEQATESVKEDVQWAKTRSRSGRT